MASNVPRKRKQDLTHIRTLEKCPRVEENDSQEVFCVDSDGEVDDGDCIVVSQKITIKRGRCQNPACLSPEGTKLQKASRRVQDFYGHSYKKGRIWRICEVCYTKAEEHLGKLKNNFINHVPIVRSQFPFYGEMVALEEEDSTDDDEETLDDTVAEFMSNCASDMINTIFEKYDINFQVEEGVKKLLEGYEKIESQIKAEIKSCEEIASSFRSSCDDFYKENEFFREELPAVEIDSGPEEVTIDDNSDGDDVIVVESVRSLQNMPEELNENTSLTQNHPVCPNQSSVTEQTSETHAILPDVSHATTTNHQIFGELRTIVKLSGGNSGSSSKETNVVNGCIPDKRNSDKQSIPVNAAGTDGMLRDSNMRVPGKDSSAQKHQTAIEGGGTESAPIHCVPLQQLLQQGLSVLGAQARNTSMREKQDHKEQQSSSQVPKEHTNIQLHKHLQQRFSVLNPSTETASAQKKHQHETHQLHGHTAPVSQQQQVIGNVQSMQRQQQHVSQTPHNAVNQHCRQQISQTNQQSSGYYMTQPAQHLREQQLRQIPSQPTGYTPPQPNVQLTPQNNTQLMSQTSLQQSGQHVNSGIQYNSAQNTYLTSKQSIQQTTAQLPPPPTEKSAFLHSQPGRQPLVCAQQQPSGYVSQPMQQPGGHVSQHLQQPSGQYISQSFQQCSGNSISNHMQSSVQLQVQSENKHKSLSQQQSSGQYFYQHSQQHSGHNVTQVLQQLNNNYMSQPSKEQASSGAHTTQKPNFVNTATALQTSTGTASLTTPPAVQSRLALQTSSGTTSLKTPPAVQSTPALQTSSGTTSLRTPPAVQSTLTLQTSSGTTSLKTPPVVQSTFAEKTATQHTQRMTDSMVHQNTQKRLNLVTGQVSHQSKVLPNRETGSLPRQHQTGQNAPLGSQCPAVQSSLVVPHMSSVMCVSQNQQEATQQNLQLMPQQHIAQNPFQSATNISVQKESQKSHQPNVKCAPLSPQLTNRVIQHSLENNATQPSVQPSVDNMSNNLVQKSRHFPPQILQNTNMTSLPSSSQPNIPDLNQSPQQDIRRTVQIVSHTQQTRQSILTEPQSRQNVTVNKEKKNGEPVAKTIQQLNGLRNMPPTCQNSSQDPHKNSQIFKSHLGPQCPQKQNGQPVSQSLQQSGKQMVSQVPHQYSGQNVNQIPATSSQQQTSQSVRELCEPNSLKLQQHPQQQQKKQQATSHVRLTGEIINIGDTESYLQRPSESSVPGNPLVSSKTMQNPHMEVESPKNQGQVGPVLGIKQSQQQQQQQQQQKQYTPTSSSQEPRHHTPLTMSDTGCHQTCSKTQAQDPKNHLQLSDERTQQSLNNGASQQNMSQPLQHLKNRQSEKTDLKVQPVIPLQKSQSLDQGGHPQHSNQQMSSSEASSQVVPSSTNLQIQANASQQSVVSQFPGNLFVMLQQQQMTMMLGFVCDILSRFLPMVMQQQRQNESTQVAVAPSSVTTSLSQVQNSKVIPNKDDLRLPEKDGNEMSDTESMCQSPVESSTPFSTPTKSLMCTSPSTLSSSTDSDISVSDSIEVCAEKDIVTVGKIVIRESNLPPLGLVSRPPVIEGDSMYIMNDIKRPWILGTVRDIVTQNNQTLYTVEFVNSKNKQMKETKKVAGFQLAYSQVQDFRFSVGHRIISIFRDGISDEDYYSGVIAEPPKSINRYRYLVFFDNGGSQYVKHQDIRLVMESSPSVWEDVHIEIREFVQNYLEKYPERALLKVQEGQEVRTEWNRRWYNAKVLKVDASLARMSFPSNGKHVEWIYRGSARFYPLFEAQNRTSKEQFARSKAFARKKGDPYIQYTLKEEEELDKDIKAIMDSRKGRLDQEVTGKETDNETDEHEAITDETEPSYRSTARKSTSQLTAQYPRLSSTVKTPKRIFYPCYSQVAYKAHRCKPSCVIDGSSDEDYTNYRNLLSHLSEPMLHGWTREKVRHSEYVSVYYRAPCKRRLRNIEELHKYLLQTKSKLTVDQFDFDHWVRCFTEGINEKYFVKIEDISNGVEAVPVPCINTVDSRKPEEITYVTKHVPTNGTYIETDPEFLICCDCIDDCSDKEKCACWRQTMEGVKYSPESESPNHEGYYYKRLYEPLVTGIYECNSRCKCSSACLNRLVQLPMKCKVQVFMTPNRGWGIRALHDIPKGSFICLYAGHVLSEKVGDALAKEVGDEYQADLDYIESAEKVKEDYEENPYENELEEDYGKKQNLKQRGQTTASKKSGSKQPKIIAPSTRVLFGRNGRYILDAKTCGNVGRYINHSCNANLFAQNVFVDTHDLRFPWVAFFTNSFVPANTELTWNYGYDVDSVPERVIICKCGETNCQGRLL